MAAFVSVLLVLLPFALYLAWRRWGPSSGEPSPRALVAMLLGVAAMLGLVVWMGLSRSFEAGSTYVPARLGPDGTVLPGHVEPRR